ncbi:hypothetical protein GOBAR_AA32741 [Gossypium barbadense]|uniref:RNase H type-1 domain-containing protein n=1 Tax=Gossypium barbadense TaxID=3634 RepID=A0A2P5WA73_GOSBA|nr:hypothetical protein GOBAR_AA32741 [Gossypium barbadense]
MANLLQRRVAPNDNCPKCRVSAENLWHVFVECLVSKELWNTLSFSWIKHSESHGCIEWLTWIFSKCTVAQCKILVCGLWVLWMDRNKNIHEGRSYIGKDAASFVRQHLVKINFDASFDDKNYQSASAIVARDYKGEIKITKSYLYSMVASAFKREAIAYHEAVLIGKAIGYTNVVIEGDSRAIINKCKAHSGDKSQMYLLEEYPGYAKHQADLERPREAD